MSKPSEVIDALLSALQDDADISAISPVFFKGVRERIIQFPAIVIEMLSITESDSGIHGEVDQEIQLAVIGYKAISNPDDGIEEMMDLSNMIKKAIEADATLGGAVIDTNIPEEHHEFVNYPVRSIAMAVNVQNRMTRAVRT